MVRGCLLTPHVTAKVALFLVLLLLIEFPKSSKVELTALVSTVVVGVGTTATTAA